MYKKAFSFMFFVTLALLAVVMLNVKPGSIIGLAYRDNAEENVMLGEIYDLKLELIKTSPGNINTFLPRYETTSNETISSFCQQFGFLPDEKAEEDQEKIIYESQGKSLTIFKNFGMLTVEYESPQEQPEAPTEIEGDKAAIEICKQFASDNMLYINYEEAKVTFNEEAYEVVFINRLSNIKNYGFTNSFTLDRFGNILKVRLYFFNYERLYYCKVMSMEAAYKRLPIDLPEGVKVELNKCQLVYYYENSIIQPAYLFEGQLNTGEDFSCFVKAAVYE